MRSFVSATASRILVIAALAYGIYGVGTAIDFQSVASHPSSLSSSALRAKFLKLPLSFEPNQGQTDARAKFIARGPGYTIFLTARDAVLSLRKRHGDRAGSVVRLSLSGTSDRAKIEPLRRLRGTSNYFIGSDPAKWRTNVPLFAAIRYAGVYPGIDLLYHGSQRQLEYDFVVAPSADTGAIKLDFAGADRIDLDSDGDLVLHAGAKQVRFRKPLAYQEFNRVRREVKARYVLHGQSSASFEIAAYDNSRELIIDPVLLYSTYLGGSRSEDGHAIAVDGAGNAYVGGATSSTDFPTMVPFQGSQPSDPMLGNPSGFVSKLNPAGDTLLYSTYLGGSCTDIVFGIAVDAAGEAYVTGTTNSGINPTTGKPDCGPLQNTFSQFPQVNALQTYGGLSDAFVTKLNATGNGLIYSSFLGGGGSEVGRAIAVDSAGNAYVTGDTISKSPTTTNFPTTSGAFQTSNAGGEDAFVAKINHNDITSVTTLAYSTYLGGGDLDSGRGVTTDSSGNIYVTGLTASGSINTCGMIANPPAFPTTAGAYQTAIAPSPSSGCIGCCPPNFVQYTPNNSDAFISELRPAGLGNSDLVYSTYLGGGMRAVAGHDANDEGHAIALDSAGKVYVTGLTAASDFPTKNAFQPTYQGGTQGDAFISKLQLNGNGPNDLLYSSYLASGGALVEGNGIAVDARNNAYVGGTGSGAIILPINATPMPTPPGSPGSPASGAFVAKIDSSPSVVFLGVVIGSSNGAALALDPLGNAYITGTTSGGLTTVNPEQANYAGNNDAFVAKIGEPPPTFDASDNCGSTTQVEVEANIGFSISARDSDPTDPVTLSVAGLPAGATMTPALPQTGNPVSSAFSWTPLASQAGTYVITFTATESSGQRVQCVKTIEVLLPIETGRATALSATTPAGTQTIADTGDVSTSQPSSTENDAAATPPNAVVDARGLKARVDTVIGKSISEADAAGALINAGGLTIQASDVRAHSESTCAATAGETDIGTLTINGMPIAGTNTQPPPNTAVPLPNGGQIVLNQQSFATTGKGLTIVALHATFGGVDVSVGRASSGIQNCPAP